MIMRANNDSQLYSQLSTILDVNDRNYGNVNIVIVKMTPIIGYLANYRLIYHGSHDH